MGYVTVSDLDGDGNPDIYVGMANGGNYEGDQYQNNTSYALMGSGDGTFAGAPELNAGGFNGAYTGTNLGDVNGDGVPDLLVPSTGGGFTVFTGNGKGIFAAASTFTAPASSPFPAPAASPSPMSPSPMSAPLRPAPTRWATSTATTRPTWSLSTTT